MEPTEGISARTARSERPSRRASTRSRALRVLAATAAVGTGVLLLAPNAQADGPGSLTMGPQAMEGDLKLAPGTTLQVGYDFTIPGTHVEANITFDAPQVAFTATCASGAGGGTFVVAMPSATYNDPASSSSWYPSGDQHSDAVYQGQLAVPDLCAGGLVRLAKGGTFTTTVTSDATVKGVNVRWHYRANGTSGSWSGTKGVVPGSGGTTTTTFGE